MSKGLGRVQRDILHVLFAESWDPQARVPLPSMLPQYSEKSVYRALAGLVEYGLVEADRRHLTRANGERAFMVVRITDEGRRQLARMEFIRVHQLALMSRRMFLREHGIPVRFTMQDVIEVADKVCEPVSGRSAKV